jgi:cbb3-type cytochrome oxidase maturation protein
MSIIVLLIACSLILALFFLGYFIWAVRTGQYNDRFTPSVRMIYDDGVIEEKNTDSKNDST